MTVTGELNIMGIQQLSVSSRVGYIHEIMFSLNLASAVIAGLFLYGPASIVSELFRMEISIQTLLHVHQTDLHLGYWAFLLPATVLALCIWILLRLSSGIRFAQEIFRSFSGIAAVAAVPIYWLCATYSSDHRYGWNPFHVMGFYEVMLALIFVLLYLRSPLFIPWWGSVSIVILHYGLWFRYFGTYYVIRTGNGGPINLIPIIGLISTLAWVLYIWRSQREQHQVGEGVSRPPRGGTEFSRSID
jgi:hypothetical protein